MPRFQALSAALFWREALIQRGFLVGEGSGMSRSLFCLSDQAWSAIYPHLPLASRVADDEDPRPRRCPGPPPPADFGPRQRRRAHRPVDRRPAWIGRSPTRATETTDCAPPPPAPSLGVNSISLRKSVLTFSVSLSKRTAAMGASSCDRRDMSVTNRCAWHVPNSQVRCN